MAEFGIPDQPGFRGAPVLGPLAASVAGLTQGLERGLESRAAQKAALAKQRAQEKAAKIKAGASLAKRLSADFGDLTKGDTEKVKDISRQKTALEKRFGDPLSNLTDEQKQKMRFDINLLSDEEDALRESLSSFSRLEVVVRSLPPAQQAIVQQNFVRATEFRDFVEFEDFLKFKKQFTAPFDSKVGQALGEFLEAERERGTIRVRRDILGPAEIVLDKEDESFLDGILE